MWFLVLIFFLSLIIFHVSTRYSRYGKLINKIQGPQPYPLIGNLLMFNVPRGKLFKVLHDLGDQYKPVVKCWLFSSAVVGIRHPDDLEIVLSNPRAITKGHMYEFLQPWLKTGLLTSTDSKWQKRRKILTPAFHFQILKKYMEVTSEQGEKLVEFLKNDGNETIKNLATLCCNYTLNIICESAMGVALDQLKPEIVAKYISAIQDMGEVVVQRARMPYLPNWMMRLPILKIARMQMRALKVLHDFTDQVLKNRREYHKLTEYKYLKEWSNDDDISENSGESYERKKKFAMLDMLLLLEQKGLIDENGIKEEIDTFTFEGHDTTGIALMYILLLLAENKECQNKIRSEVTEILDQNEKKMDQSVLQQFQYLERCIKEALRLYPSVPTISRISTEDIKLRDYIIPAGVEIMCFMYNLHRDEDFWPDPYKFDPDRFLPEQSINRHPFAYLPFSAGYRNCIGQKFAMQELKSLVAHIVHNFYLEPIDRLDDVIIATDLVMRPSHPIRLKFIKVNKI